MLGTRFGLFSVLKAVGVRLHPPILIAVPVPLKVNLSYSGVDGNYQVILWNEPEFLCIGSDALFLFGAGN